MKILQITNKVPVPPKDGGSIASFRLSQGLADRNQQVHLLAMNTSKHYINPGVIKSFEKRNLSITAIKIQTRLNAFKALWNLLFAKLPYNAVRFISADFGRELKSLIGKEKPDLIIIENLYPSAYLNLIRESTDSPVMYRAHNIESEIWERTAENSSGIKKWYLLNLAKRIKRLETGFINQYDLLVPITERDAQWFKRMGNIKPTFVLPTGFYGIKKDFKGISVKKPVIAHLGALDWHPNQEGILWFVKNVWNQLRKTIPGIEFHIAGRNAPGWFKREITRDGIVFHGEIDDASEFILEHPVHIVPLFSGSGMRIKIIESMAYGRAVITTSLGTEGIETRNGSNIIVANEPREFVESVRSLLENEEYCRKIGENAFTFVREELDNDRLVSELLIFLKENAWL